MAEGGPPRVHKKAQKQRKKWQKKKSESTFSKLWVSVKGLQWLGEHLGKKIAESKEEQQTLCILTYLP